MCVCNLLPLALWLILPMLILCPSGVDHPQLKKLLLLSSRVGRTQIRPSWPYESICQTSD